MSLKGFFRTEVIFLMEIFNFHQKNNFGPIDFSPHVFFFVEKKQCVVNHTFFTRSVIRIRFPNVYCFQQPFYGQN